MTQDNTVMVYVPLLDEGTPTIRGTQAIPMGGDLYKILPTPNYDPEDETWEFLPGSIVRCDEIKSAITGKQILRAYEVQNANGTFARSTEMLEK